MALWSSGEYLGHQVSHDFTHFLPLTPIISSPHIRQTSVNSRTMPPSNTPNDLHDDLEAMMASSSPPQTPQPSALGKRSRLPDDENDFGDLDIGTSTFSSALAKVQGPFSSWIEQEHCHVHQDLLGAKEIETRAAD